MMRIFYVILFFISVFDITNAQDPQFTQFYAAPLYLAPSFAGATQESRFGVIGRNQWEGVGGFDTYMVSFDHSFANFHSGIGAYILDDYAGSGHLGVTMISIEYSYDFNILDLWHVRPGLSLTYDIYGIDFNKLVFPDQITSASTNAPTSPGVLPPANNNTGSIDAGTSVLVYSDRTWIGAGVDHLLEPNESLYGGTSIVPLKITAFGGYTLIKNKHLLKPIDETVSFAILLRHQAEYNQADIGLYWNRYPLVLGFWYRGLPKINSNIGDMIAFLIGFKFVNKFSIGYSYDFTISNLVGSSRGANEISIIYQFETKRAKKRGAIPCPEF